MNNDTQNDLPGGYRMHTPFTLIALCTCLLWLGACDKTRTTPPTPRANVPASIESSTAGSFASAAMQHDERGAEVARLMR